VRWPRIELASGFRSSELLAGRARPHAWRATSGQYVRRQLGAGGQLKALACGLQVVQVDR